MKEKEKEKERKCEKEREWERVRYFTSKADDFSVGPPNGLESLYVYK